MTQPEFGIVIVVILLHVVVVFVVDFGHDVYVSSSANTFVVCLTDNTTNWHSR